MKYNQHPLSAAFPAMPDSDYRALVEDIRQNGQRDPATLADGMVVDGWHRYRACEELGIPCRFDAFTGSDAVSFVRSKNQHRRHYQKSQQAAIEVALTAWAEAHRPKKGEAASPFSTNKEMAERAGVTERTIIHAKRAHEAGLGQAVRDGKVSAEKADKLAKIAPSEAAAVARGEKALDRAIKDIGRIHQKPVAKPEIAFAEAPEDDANAEILRDYEQLISENARLTAIVEASDVGKAALAEANKYRELARVLQERVNGLMNEKNAALSQAKSWMRKCQAAEKKLKEAEHGVAF